MSYEVVYNPKTAHRCELPPTNKYPVGTIIRCTDQPGLTKREWAPQCGQKWVLKKFFNRIRWEQPDYGW